MINWIKITEDSFQRDYDDMVLAVDNNQTMLMGWLYRSPDKTFRCNLGNTSIYNVQYYILLEELLKTLPTKKEE